ncbi:MAG: class II aldolase/adducin family protein [Phycisphaerae bacterium]
MSDWPLRHEMVDIARRMHARGYVAASDGNLSCRAPGNAILVTASGTHLGELTPDDIVRVSPDGRVTAGTRRPSSELPLHLEVYRRRADVQAVVHAHPPTATAFTFAGVSMAECVIPEVVLTLGTIPTAPYATPGSAEGPAAIGALIVEHDAVLLERHGSVTVGRSLSDAYYKLEKLEHAAHVLLVARQLGRVISLSRDELTKIAQVRERLGLGSMTDVWKYCR